MKRLLCEHISHRRDSEAVGCVTAIKDLNAERVGRLICSGAHTWAHSLVVSVCLCVHLLFLLIDKTESETLVARCMRTTRKQHLFNLCPACGYHYFLVRGVRRMEGGWRGASSLLVKIL